MRRLIIIYTLIVLWTSGWLVGAMGWGLSLLPCGILILPATAGWNISRSGRDLRWKDLLYGGIAVLIAFGLSAGVVVNWYQAAMVRRSIFERQFFAFRHEVLQLPEWERQQLKTSYILRHDGWAYLSGQVLSKEFYDRLIEMADRQFQGRFSDSIDYPGRSKSL